MYTSLCSAVYALVFGMRFNFYGANGIVVPSAVGDEKYAGDFKTMVAAYPSTVPSKGNDFAAGLYDAGYFFLLI